MKYRSINLALACAASVGVWAAQLEQASAQSPPPPAAPQQEGLTLRVACGQDLQNLCPGLVKKDARQCLRAHSAQLSAACSAFLQEAQG